ncbi:MAG: DUF4105 domain-containing protein [Proteobacteria bacterium]|nr:DUF4105 domain-containing protein [Pseudomonadota bacterium]
MLQRFIFISLCFALLFTTLAAKSFTTDKNIEIELLTFGPGINYWEAFGHSALRVKTANQDYAYGFGYFDFADEDFFWKFAKGEMQYFLGIQPTALELDDYMQQGRAIWSQKLNLTATQKHKLVAKLNFLSLPENRFYHYDYFLNNCTSQIRDLLDEVTNGEISAQLKLIETTTSWSDKTFPVNNMTWINLGIAIAYGVPAYHTRSQWQLSIFPEDFANDLENLTTNSNWNSPLKLINSASEKRVVETSFVATHYAVVLIVLGLLLGIGLKFTRSFTINTWLIAQSILGIGLLLLWFLTQHTVAAYNINVLLFLPLSFLLVFKRFNKAHYRKIFLCLNLIWLVLALFFTNLYLLGFLLINLFIVNRKFLSKS